MQPDPSPLLFPLGLGIHEDTGLPWSRKEIITPALLASGLTIQACKRDLRDSVPTAHCTGVETEAQRRAQGPGCTSPWAWISSLQTPAVSQESLLATGRVAGAA